MSQVHFSVPGGFYHKPFSLALTANSGTVHYTVDGTEPTAESPVCDSSLLLSPELYSTRDLYLRQNTPDDLWEPPSSVGHVIAIRAAAFDTFGNRVGKESVNTYFVSELTGYRHSLPMVSIVVSPDALFDADSGIFSPNGWDADDDFVTGNFNQHGIEWERFAHVEFYEVDGRGFSQWLGIRVHGYKTRRIMQKPLKLYARKEYGGKTIDYPLFATRDYSSFKRLVLKPFSSSWNHDGLSDMVAQTIADPLAFVSMATRPVTVFINGEYWGIYYLQESPDERLIAQVDNVDSDDVTIIGSWGGLEENGSNDLFLQLMDYLNEADFSDSNQYRQICSLIDIDDFIDYQLYEGFIANNDWPANNMRCYQHGSSQWRWLFFDGDAALRDSNYNTKEYLTYTGDNNWPSSAEATLCFRRLLQSPEFTNRLLNRMSELCLTVFDYSNTSAVLDNVVATIQEEVFRQSKRFKYPWNYSIWVQSVEIIDNFLRSRVSSFERDIAEMLTVALGEDMSFQLFPNPANNTVTISIDSDTTGLVSYEILDCMGRRVKAGDCVVSRKSNNVVDISQMKRGVYYVRIMNNGKNQRLVVR